MYRWDPSKQCDLSVFENFKTPKDLADILCKRSNGEYIGFKEWGRVSSAANMLEEQLIYSLCKYLDEYITALNLAQAREEQKKRKHLQPGDTIAARTDVTIERILELQDAGMSQKEIAEKLGVSRSTIWRRMKEELPF